MSYLPANRRAVLKAAGALLAGRSLARGQATSDASLPRLPPLDELVNAFEYEDEAQRVLPAPVYSTIAGSDRAAFDRITFRPRLMVSSLLDLDLSVGLFGASHFAPILVGPVADQRRYHPEAELATMRGAEAARAAVIVSSHSSVPIEAIVAQAGTPLWYAVYAEAGARTLAREAVAAGCTVVCVTIDASLDGGRAVPNPNTDWMLVEQICQDLDVPVVVKGVTTPQEAQTALQRGAQGLVVSNHGGVSAGAAAPIERLSAIADVAGEAVVLIDGSFRRGSDLLKALVLGAQGVLLGRPVMWGLAAYGAQGVQSLIEMLQSDLARNMGAIGAPNLKSLTRAMVKIHAS